jgi:glyoxylase-like metal-dependent hydrolase (beta-lactamase superfamily II)
MPPVASPMTAPTRIIRHIEEHQLKLEWLIETHVHADHLSAAPYIQAKLGGKLGIGENITLVQDTFGKIFNEGTEFQRDGSQFDRLFKDGDSLPDRRACPPTSCTRRAIPRPA